MVLFIINLFNKSAPWHFTVIPKPPIFTKFVPQKQLNYSKNTKTIKNNININNNYI